ncbi:MAG: hypothetical protein ACKVP2_17695 [Burkholderiales bacterium]
MAFEALAKPVVDALLKALDRARDSRLKSSARKAVGEAISELIRIDADVGKAEAKIAIARAAGILDRDLFTAERMLRKVRKATGAGKIRRRPAAKRVRSRKAAVGRNG